MKRGLQIVVLAAVLAATVPVWGTPTLMQQLPTSSRFRCLNCHTIQDPGPTQAALNQFGQAFKNNAMRWDAQLARGNADGDNCTNGFELADQNGDGTLDAKAERSNPGDPDCALELSPETWSNLKILFR